MRTFILALKSMRCQRFSLAIILVQLAVCFAILIYTVGAFLGQFDIIITANGVQNGSLYLSPDYLYLNKYQSEYHGKGSLDFLSEYHEQQEEGTDSSSTPEQSKSLRYYLLDRYDEEYDKYHYKGKYLFLDLHESLNKSGLISNTLSITRSWVTVFTDENGNTYSVIDNFGNVHSSWTVNLMDKNLYNGLKLDTINGKNLMDYETKENYFYAVIYPVVTIHGEVYELPYDIGDVLTQEVYNIKTHTKEQFKFEIVDKFKDPAYILPEVIYSGDISSKVNLENFLLGVQPMNYSGALIAMKPENFDDMAYYTDYTEYFDLVKPKEGLTADEYSQLIQTIRDCGFNTVNLDEATENTLDNIWKFIRENCLILAISALTVVFSIISVSMLSGSQVRRECAIYKLCGASKGKIKNITAVKWALIFIPSIIAGIILSIIYSAIQGVSIRFIMSSTLISAVMFILLYLLSVILSYRSASAGYSSADLSE